MLSKNKQTTYEVSPLTMAIVAIETAEGAIETQVYETDATYLVRQTPLKLIDYACRFFGSSLRGRLDGTRDVCGVTHKAPISVNPTNGMYFFPTTSPQNKNCSWIAHSHIDFIKEAEFQQTKIFFKNGESIIVDVSYGSMMNQIQRTAQFRYLLADRMKKISTVSK